MLLQADTTSQQGVMLGPQAAEDEEMLEAEAARNALVDHLLGPSTAKDGVNQPAEVSISHAQAAYASCTAAQLLLRCFDVLVR